ncbi:MAG: hypothetical protein PVH77_09730 [Phycisphaerales bacterium]|jgi:hypothetical protein
MKQNARNSISGTKRIYNQLAAEKKKAVMALCLITLMVFMWGRVLTKSEPEAAEAARTAGQVNDKGQSEPELKISFIELPQIAGRNDVISRDFFTLEDWQSFIGGQGRKSAGVEEVNIVSKNGDQEVIKKVAEKLELKAIVSGESPLAFINDNVLSVGGKVFVVDGADKYECEVFEIKEDAVVIKFGEARITLKLTQMN